MELVNSAPMQLGRWGFVEASMFMFTVADTVAIATHLRSSALLWLLASCFVLLCLCIADFPRNIKVYSYIRDRYQHYRVVLVFQYSDKTNEGMNK